MPAGDGRRMAGCGPAGSLLGIAQAGMAGWLGQGLALVKRNRVKASACELRYPSHHAGIDLDRYSRYHFPPKALNRLTMAVCR